MPLIVCDEKDFMVKKEKQLRFNMLSGQQLKKMLPISFWDTLTFAHCILLITLHLEHNNHVGCILLILPIIALSIINFLVKLNIYEFNISALRKFKWIIAINIICVVLYTPIYFIATDYLCFMVDIKATDYLNSILGNLKWFLLKPV